MGAGGADDSPVKRGHEGCGYSDMIEENLGAHYYMLGDQRTRMFFLLEINIDVASDRAYIKWIESIVGRIVGRQSALTANGR